MDCNYTKIKTCELKGSTFRTRILDFGTFDISQYEFTAVYTGFAGKQELLLERVANTLPIPFSPIQDATGNHQAEIWMEKDGERDLAVLFEITISADNCGCDDVSTHDVTITFKEESFPVTVSQAIVNNLIDYESLTEQQKAELRFDYEDFTPKQIEELQKPALDARAWSPVISLDSLTLQKKVLMKIDDWTGGTGEKPTEGTGQWLKVGGGFTGDPMEAENLKGVQGDISLLEFEVNEEMELLQHYEGIDLDFSISLDGDLTLTF